MIKRILSSKLPLIVYNPLMVFDMNYFKQSYLAGALPVLDTEFMDSDSIIEIINQIEQEDILFGIRLFVHDTKIIDFLKQNYIPNLDLIVFAYGQPDELKDFSFDNSDYKFFIEAIHIGLDQELKRIGPHGVIVKGNEAPGRVSKYTGFILMQWYLLHNSLPIFMHGGVGFYTAAGMFASGVNGIVLDDQLYLSDEAPLSEGFKDLLSKLDGNDSIVIGQTLNTPYRFFAKLGTKIVKELKQKESSLFGQNRAGEDLYKEIKLNICRLDNNDTVPIQSLFFLGQDAIFAKRFVQDSCSLKDIIANFFENIAQMLQAIDEYDPIQADSPLAKEHGTKLPIIQGPMANVSDNAEFASQVFENGALPFFAMGSLPPDLSDKMLEQGKKKVSRFGAGLIGIEALNQGMREHFEQVKKYEVPFALFAAGVPAQVKELEFYGTKTYLHTPSIMMLENAIKNGCTRFIFEGTEAGGHIGSQTSFALWETGISRLMKQSDEELAKQTVMFAGGISTKFASWFISGISSMLAKRGAKVGIQIGSIYLFTQEIVETGAIGKLYQEIIIERDETIVIGNTVGLPSRTIINPFSQTMMENEHKRIQEGWPLEDRKKAFEGDNIGALLIASKAFSPSCIQEDGTCNYFNQEEQYNRGNFMIGDSLAFESSQITIPRIHNRYFNTKAELNKNLNFIELFSSPDHLINDEIAIVGMGCIYPDADNPDQLWRNIINKKYSIKEISQQRFDADLYYDPDKKAEDKSYTKMAGTVDNFKFNYEKYGYIDEKAEKLSKSQQMILEAAYQAVKDAGYLEKNMRLKEDIREKTAVIIGTCLGNELGNDLHLKYYYPEIRYYFDQIDEFKNLDQEQKDTFLEAFRHGLSKGKDGYEPVHGVTLNIEASRIAHHLGIEGVNYVVDAACATSFAAFDCAIKELVSGNHDVVIAGGVNTHMAPEPFVGFCKMGALSANGSWPFDERADGFVLGEGAGVIILKRAKDAIKDNDKIYGIIKGMGSSSDGKGKAIAAPNTKGQALALQRCFESVKSNDISYDDIDYIEAHGTSTIMGDLAELQTIQQVYKTNHPIGISSIKSQIGHLLGGSGAAGVIKTLLALKNKTLPPNGHFEKLSPEHKLEGSSFYIIEDSAKWEVSENKSRKAAISSYGFGGINFHCIVEEFSKNYKPVSRNIFNNLDYDFNDNRIVIAGLGVMLPGAKNVEEFWEKLTQGKSVVSSKMPETRFHNKYYAMEDDKSDYKLPEVKAGIVKDYQFNNIQYRIPPLAAKSIDRAQMFALDAAYQAIENAKLNFALKPGNKVGVVLGTIPGEMQVENVMRVRIPFVERVISQIKDIDGNTKSAISQKLSNMLKDRYVVNTEDTIPGLLSNIVSGRIANYFGCNAANFVVDASCASSNVAMDLAIKGLKSKDYDYVLTGGVDTNLYPTVMLAFKRLSLLSDNECKFFDKNSSGYIMGEGAAILVMTTYKKAIENNMPVLAEFHNISFKSSVPNHLLSPSEKVYARAIDTCYQNTWVNKNQIDYLDVFGCCNTFLDQMEKQAIESSFNKKIWFGNVKPEFGYFKAANPAVALSKLVLMAKNKTILSNNSFSKDTSIVSPKSVLIPNDKLLSLRNKNQFCFASNVNGIGGDHGHMVIGSIPVWMEKQSSQKGTVIPLKTAKATGSKDQFEDKKIAALKQPASAFGSYAIKGIYGLAALLSGQGSQYNGMMKELYDTNSFIKDIMDRGEQIFKEKRGYSLLNIMFNNDKAINLTQNTQPAVFMATASIFTYLKNLGFNPDCFIGHSVGEYSALYCSGMLNFDDAMQLLIKRSDFMKESTEAVPGKIMVIFGNASHSQNFIKESGFKNIYIANKNSEKQTGIAGEAKEIEAFCNFLQSKGAVYRKLALSAAFHTPLLKDASEKLREHLNTIKFNNVDFSKVISNVTALPYPNDEMAVKDLLAKQITSPLEFITSVENVYNVGIRDFVEIGTGKILINLLKNISVDNANKNFAIDPKKGETDSLNSLIQYLAQNNRITQASPQSKQEFQLAQANIETPQGMKSQQISYEDTPDFESFIAKNEKNFKNLMYQEYIKHKREKAIEDIEKFNFYTGKIAIAGVSIGLPGTGNKVFNDDNFDKLLSGTNFIEPLHKEEKQKIVDMNITRIFKEPDGNAKFVDIISTEDVIQLAGKLGYFNLKNEYGIEYSYDVTIALAIAAGLESLKDAKIPLVMNYKETPSGRKIPDGFTLPLEMQDNTGVIMTSLFPGFETLINQMNQYYYNKFYVKPYDEFESIYYHLMEKVTDKHIKERITDWFFRVKQRSKQYAEYRFDRNLLFDIVPLGSAHFAQLIRAKGPNIQMSGACASTTQAIGVAEDWIRAGRCDRVIIIGGEAPTTEAQNPWVGSGFLAMGAATVKSIVSEAAKPFDTERNGTILGSGAVSLIVEREDYLKKRGLNGQAEILGTFIGNSAYHATQIDVRHLTNQMKNFITKVEKHHNLKQEEYTKSMLFMSHETFTPARGGSASAEVSALRTTFPDYYSTITITNTKGFTGHTLGAALEDAVMVKALQKGFAPPIANLKNIPKEFTDLNLNLNKGNQGPYGYALHLAAGFGSHFALLFLKRIPENNIENNPDYTKWLQQISGTSTPILKLIKGALCLESSKVDTTQPAIPILTPAAPIEHTPGPQPIEKPVVQQTAPKQPGPAILPTVQQIIADQTGYTIDMLEPDLDLEADLGIDTVKQVEIFGKVSSSFDLQVPEDLKLSDLNTINKLSDYIASKTGAQTVIPTSTEAVSTSGASAQSIMPTVQQIIADQTGYTIDMLEPDLDLEADLGIDTVKQVEIFGKVSSSFDLQVPEDLKLSDLNTINKLSDYIASKTGAQTVIPTSTEAVSTSGESAQSIMPTVQQIIADQTGYTIDMLEPDLDLEADLGIDTVKQVEIFGKVSSSFDLQVPEDLKLSDLNTINKLSDYIASKTGAQTTEAQAVQTTQQVTAPQSQALTQDVHAKVQEIIAEQTGYTVDMLEPDLDLEADLGIDTVKQVEIFGKVSSSFDLQVPEDLKLSDLNTINKLANYIISKTQGVEVEAKPVQTPQQQEILEPQEQESPIKRLTVHVKTTESPKIEDNIFKDKTFIVTLDKHGFAQSVISRIKENNGKVITLGMQGDIKIDLSNLDEVENLKEKISDIHGFIHLYPLNYCFDNNEITKQELDGCVKMFFLTIKNLYPYLDQKGALISTLSFDSVIFPYLELKNTIYPVSAALCGMMKTVNKELQETLVKAVDFSYSDPLSKIDEIADRYIKELMSGDSRVETGYKQDDDKKYILYMKESKAEAGKSFVNQGDNFLVTGGAGGITYEILKSVVDKHKCNLIIFDINDIYNIDQDFLSQQADEHYIMGKLKTTMKGVKPLEIKREVGRIMRVKQAVSNIEYLKSKGIEVTYHVVDVTNYESVESAIKKHDKIDGVLHAAGMEQSQFIAKKEFASFNRVFNTKIYGCLNLLKALKDRDYNFFITFSSVTARFGNEGQIDYTGANDMLGKLLQREKAIHPEREYKIPAWTAWGGVGMATNETVRKVLEERGLQFLPLEQGVQFFVDEISDHTTQEAVFTGIDYSFDKDGLMERYGQFPFLGKVIKQDKKELSCVRVLDLKQDLFLKDHSKDDVPIFLGATGIETMAEAAYKLAEPQGKLVEITDFFIPYGIKILKQRPKEIVVDAVMDSDNSCLCKISSLFKNPKGIVMGDPTLHYQGRYIFSTQETSDIKSDIKIDSPEIKPVQYEGDFETLIYHPERLFMDGVFRSLHDIISFNDNMMITRMSDISQNDFFAGENAPSFFTDVVIIDSIFQTGGLFEFLSTDDLVLPYKIKSMKFYKRIQKGVDYLCLTEKTASSQETNTYNLKLIDNDNVLYLDVKEFDMVKVSKVQKEFKIIDKFKIQK